MVISRISSGLGNQLFQYAIGRNLALTKKTALYIDLSYYCREYSDDTPRKFKLDLFSVSYNTLQKSPLEYLSKATRLLPNRSWRPFVAYLKEKYFHFDPQVLTEDAGCLILQGFWQSEAYFRQHADIIRRELQLSRIPSIEFEAYRQQIQDSPLPVSIHVRRGDYVSHPDFSKRFGFVGLDYYQRAVDILTKQHKNPQFFVFSDELAWAKQNLTLPEHTVFVQNTGPTADVADLVLMSRCHHHIIANSSFSWWSAWLNHNPDKLIIYPKNWFRNQPDWNTKDLHPSGWLPC